MTRNLKSLGLALVAVFAFSAMAASSASATDLFTTTQSPAHLVSEADTANVFTIESPDVAFECATATFTAASVPNGASSATVTATYTGTPGVTPHTTHCASGIGELTVDMNGCDYKLTGNTTGTDNGTDATVWVECPVGQEITMTTELVTLRIHEQTPTSGGVTYTNIGTNTVTVKTTATGITYSCAPHFFCTLGGIATEANNAIYTGSVYVKATAGNASVSS